jgi:Cu(I)/Ag(I) efflux system membrane fusion protein
MPPMRSGGQVRARGGGTYELTYALAVVGDWTIALRVTAPGHSPTELRFSLSPPRKGVVLQTRGGADSELSAAKASADGGLGQVMDISPSRQQLIGVTWGRAEKRSLTLTLRLPGKVEVDETQVADVTLRYPAFVEKLYVSQTGQSVRQGEPLLTLYSPELLAAEQDYLVAKNGGETGLVAAAEERLKLWGVSGEQLRALTARGTAEPRVTLRAPLSGVVLMKNVVEGTRAETGMALYRVGNLARVWVLADVFQTDASVVAVGQQATMSVPGLPGTSWAGRVSFIYPTVDERTRSLRLRLEFGNSEAKLRPGMYSDVSVQVPLGELLVVPDSALLRSGEHAYVFVRRGTGGLQPVEVEPGVSNGAFTEVRAGLAIGDEVATAAAFLLSSEAQLRDALPRWRTP